MKEIELIRLMLEALPPNPKRLNQPFESDSEVLLIGEGPLLFTIDGFSAEDHFRTDNPYLLGRNLAVCTVSDIFACGGRLEHFGHCVTVPPEWDSEYILHFSRGIADVVSECGACFAGGDIGCSAQWAYTGVALGRADRKLTRNGARPGDGLYISGCVGPGNFEAASGFDFPARECASLCAENRAAFQLRNREAKLVMRYANACIDSSDGLINALLTLCGLNGCGFIITRPPYFEPGRALLEILDLPLELLAAGECGEYELLCSIPPGNETDFVRAGREAGFTFHRLGTVCEKGVACMENRDYRIDFSNFSLSARDYANHSVYLHALTKFIRNARTPHQQE